MKNTSYNGYFLRLISFVVTALLIATPAFAQDKKEANGWKMDMYLGNDRGAGKVVGLDFSNPLIRNVKFTRLSDR